MRIVRTEKSGFLAKGFVDPAESVSGARCEFPGLVGKRPDHVSLCRRKFACRGAVAHAANDPLQNRGDAEEIIGEIDRQMRAWV